MNKPTVPDPADSELRTKLEQDSGIIGWKLLRPHYERGALICVQTGMDLVEIALQISKDNKPAVQQWIEETALIKPTPQQVLEWQQEGTHFRSLVVAPFVLIQQLSH